MSADQKGARRSRPSRYCQVVCRLEHLKRTGLTAFIVGTWLTMVNHWDVLATSGLDWNLVAKIGLNYLTPFVVANIGLLSRHS